MKAFRMVVVLSVASVLVGATAALAQSIDPHHPPATTAPTQVQTPEEPTPPTTTPQELAQPAQTPQGATTMNCPMMQGAQTSPGSTMNCPMVPSHGEGISPGMMHGQMQPGQPLPR